MYMGQSRGSIRDAHYTARDIEFLRKEIVDKINGNCTGTMDKTMDNYYLKRLRLAVAFKRRCSDG